MGLIACRSPYENCLGKPKIYATRRALQAVQPASNKGTWFQTKDMSASALGDLVASTGQYVSRSCVVASAQHERDLFNIM